MRELSRCSPGCWWPPLRYPCLLRRRLPPSRTSVRCPEGHTASLTASMREVRWLALRSERMGDTMPFSGSEARSLTWARYREAPAVLGMASTTSVRWSANRSPRERIAFPAATLFSGGAARGPTLACSRAAQPAVPMASTTGARSSAAPILPAEPPFMRFSGSAAAALRTSARCRAARLASLTGSTARA
jgi:hypothetical protein